MHFVTSREANNAVRPRPSPWSNDLNVFWRRKHEIASVPAFYTNYVNITAVLEASHRVGSPSRPSVRQHANAYEVTKRPVVVFGSHGEPMWSHSRSSVVVHTPPNLVTHEPGHVTIKISAFLRHPFTRWANNASWPLNVIVSIYVLCDLNNDKLFWFSLYLQVPEPPEAWKKRQQKQKGDLRHLVFPGGHPSKY